MHEDALHHPQLPARSAHARVRRILLDAGRPGEEDKAELVDLNGFGLCIYGSQPRTT